VVLLLSYDLGNNLTSLAHQANNDIWQQTITIHSNSNRGTENNGQNNLVGLVRALCVVFVVFTQNVSANVQGIALLFCFIG
jgi:hypothetical protein